MSCTYHVFELKPRLGCDSAVKACRKPRQVMQNKRRASRASLRRGSDTTNLGNPPFFQETKQRAFQKRKGFRLRSDKKLQLIYRPSLSTTKDKNGEENDNWQQMAEQQQIKSGMYNQRTRNAQRYWALEVKAHVGR